MEWVFVAQALKGLAGLIRVAFAEQGREGEECLGMLRIVARAVSDAAKKDRARLNTRYRELRRIAASLKRRNLAEPAERGEAGNLIGALARVPLRDQREPRLAFGGVIAQSFISFGELKKGRNVVRVVLKVGFGSGHDGFGRA